ncbi:hypothetical protein OIV83_004776 [Microbotryomycetes sp. JL201]|nr:hypothetical protein OIV83_004776 [Microbotryomycetes sp. JL201]
MDTVMLTLRNPYGQQHSINFDELALSDSHFAAFVKRTAKGRPTIDWHDQHAVKALSTTLLKRDFGLQVDLPDDRLCPMVPGRLEYVVWIMRLALGVLKTISHAIETTANQTNPSHISRGTGASAIYPLLACKTLENCQMLATEIDERSYTVATANVARNSLDQRIKIMLTTVKGPLLPLDKLVGHDIIDFTMCNPPFYSSAQEMRESADNKQLDAFSACTGAENEMITPGGEIAFVSRLVEESLVIGEKIRWVINYTVAELGQSQTKRWVIAWSFGDDRLSSYQYHDSSNPSIAKFLAPSNSHTYHCPPLLQSTIVDSWDMLNRYQTKIADIIKDLAGVCVTWTVLNVDKRVGVLETEWNSWNRKARRALASSAANDMQVECHQNIGTMERGTVKLEATVTLTVENQEGCRHVKIVADWTRGYDRNVKDWTTLWSFLIRKLADATRSEASNR